MRIAIALLLCGQLPFVESTDFPKELQTTALAATVRVANTTTNGIGTGVIVRQQGVFVYLLTAWHIVDKADTIEVAVYSARSYPKPEKVYAKVEVIARTRDADLALLRLVTRDAMPGVLAICPPAKSPGKGEFPALSCGLGSDKVPACWADTVSGAKVIRKPGGATSTVWELKREPAQGSSGGPLIDKRGYVLGIGSGRSDGKGYYAHLDELHGFLKQNDAQRLLEDAKD